MMWSPSLLLLQDPENHKPFILALLVWVPHRANSSLRQVLLRDSMSYVCYIRVPPNKSKLSHKPGRRNSWKSPPYCVIPSAPEMWPFPKSACHRIWGPPSWIITSSTTNNICRDYIQVNSEVLGEHKIKSKETLQPSGLPMVFWAGSTL